MLEEYLKKESVKTVANNPEIYKQMKGETIRAVISGIPDPDLQGWFDLFVFESGCSFTRHSKGGYWINNKEETREILMNRFESLRGDALAYKELSELLELPSLFSS